MRLVIVACLLASACGAQTKMACSELRALTGYEFSVISAEAQGSPEYCLVRAMVMPEIRIVVELPREWNRKLLMTGNGGFAGEALDTPQNRQRAQSWARNGFIWTMSNTGHDARVEPGASFAANRQKLLDFGFRSLHVTAETAKRLAQAYYGARPARSYYVGCSTGGRQGLILAQRFPEDFDGIYAGAPVLDWTGTLTSFACVSEALTQAQFPASKQKLLSDAIYAKCDKVDGLEDGVIDDPRKCNFDAARDLPACAAGADNADCFTAAQVSAIAKMHTDLMSRGTRFFPGWPVGAEIDAAPGSGWASWFLDKGIDQQMSQSFFRYMVAEPPDDKWTAARLDMDRDPDRLGPVREIINAADPDLSAFHKRGGKLILTHGWADQALNPLRTIEYYESVRTKMGAATDEFLRFYLMPGVLHCGGGPGAGNFDQLSLLVKWVEESKAPERIVASRMENGKATRTRPLCPYPQVAKYKGMGNVDDEASFVCAGEVSRR